MSDIKRLRNKVEQLKGEKNQVERALSKVREEVKTHRRSVRDHEQALEVIKEVGLQTQRQLQYHISEITSLALEAVFSDPYKLVAEFVERRNKTECDLWFQRNGVRTEPINGSGGGAVDVAAFALRVASWSMQSPKSRNAICLDEPLRFLSKELQNRASAMIKEISEKLGVQFIIITHEETLTSHADRVFKVTNAKGKSKVEVE